jgi:hypothetical protein
VEIANKKLCNSLARFFIYICSVRITSLILALYTMVLSLVPCSDDIAIQPNGDCSISSIENHSHNHESETEDSCTPFCICQCCGSSILPPLYAFIDSNKKAENSKYYPNYVSNYSFDFKGGVWHPPSVS